MSDQHAQGYYAYPGSSTQTQAGPVENWSIPADSISGPAGNVFDSGLGSNVSNFAGLAEMPPGDIVNSNQGPIPPTPSIVPTI